MSVEQLAIEDFCYGTGGAGEFLTEPSGDITSPSYTFSSGGGEFLTSTINDNDVYTCSGGGEAMIVHTDGSVGLGTQSPASTLHINTSPTTWGPNPCQEVSSEIEGPPLSETYVTREEYNSLANRITTLLDRIDKIKDGRK